MFNNKKTLTEFQNYLDKRAFEYNRSLELEFEKRRFDAPKQVVEAVKYALFSGGKRIRPIITLEVARCFSGRNTGIVRPLADAIEFIHTYSLIHDDLPAMDDATFRRGRKTVHEMYGEDLAILTGDALLNLAIEQALDGIPYAPTLEVRNYIAALRTLFNFSGMNGLIGGQVADTIEGVNRNKFNLEYIEKHKTAALISAAVLCGAIPYVGLRDEKIQPLFRYSIKIGKIFQIVDDILDVTSDEFELGKDVGADKKNDRLTYVSEHSIGEAWREVERLKRAAFFDLDELEKNEEEEGQFQFLYDLAEYFTHRKN